MGRLVGPLVCRLVEPLVGLWMGPSMSLLAEPLAEPLMKQSYFRRSFHARAASTVLASIEAPLSWLGISAILPAAAAAVLGLPLHTSGPPLTLHIFPKLSAFLPKIKLVYCLVALSFGIAGSGWRYLRYLECRRVPSMWLYWVQPRE